MYISHVFYLYFYIWLSSVLIVIASAAIEPLLLGRFGIGVAWPPAPLATFVSFSMCFMPVTGTQLWNTEILTMPWSGGGLLLLAVVLLPSSWPLQRRDLCKQCEQRTVTMPWGGWKMTTPYTCPVYLAPQICHFWNFGNFGKRYFEVFGLFSKLISISVSAVACTWFLAVGSASFLAQKVSREAKTDVIFFFMSLKRDVCQHFAAIKAGKHNSFYEFWYKILYFAYKRTFASFWLNFNQKLANIPPRQNVGKHTPPPNLGGLYIIISISLHKSLATDTLPPAIWTRTILEMILLKWLKLKKDNSERTNLKKEIWQRTNPKGSI